MWRRVGLLVLGLALGCEGVVDDGAAGPRGTSATPGILPAAAPGPAALPRLTGPQYRGTLEEIFGADLPPTPVEPDTNPHLFFTIGAASTTLSEVGAQQYEENAHAIAAHAMAPSRRAAWLGCEPSAVDDACATHLVVDVGRRLYRRPLTEAERARWTEVARTLGEGDAARGLTYALAGMLQSPQFLYRAELGHPAGERLALDAYELASRLAFLLWNRAPDDALLDAAEGGALDTEDGIYATASAMLDDPRARGAVTAFFAQVLDLGRLAGIARDPAVYPAMTPTLAASMRTEVERLVDDLVFRRDADIRELLRTRRTFVNDELARLYGVEAEGATPITFVPVELPADGPRAGLLTLGAFLAMNAHPTETSPTLRGKFVRERLLCDLVPPPPPGVSTNIERPDPSRPRTLRERLEEHRQNPACASCHASIDPPGVLFEGFDSIGAVRALDHGLPVDTSGALDGIPLEDGRALGELLADDPRVPLCLTRQLFRHALGRLETPGEEPAIRAVNLAFVRGGHRVRDLFLELAIHAVFRTAAPPEEVAP